MKLPSLDGNEKDKNKKSPGLPAIDDKGLPNVDSFDLPQISDEIETENFQNFEDDFEEEQYEDFGNAGDGFRDVDIEDVLNEEDDFNDEIYQDVDNIMNEESQKLPSTSYHEEDYYATEDDYNPDYEDDLENNKKKKFIDRENKRIIPFGGRKSKRKVKSSDFDDRKNLLAKTKVVRFIIMVITLFMFLFGLKNTFLPSHVYTDEQIRQFAREGAGQTGFPSERGEAFVEDFMKVYLTIDRSRPDYNEILAHYYGENSYTAIKFDQKNMKTGIDVKQYVIIGPTVYDVKLLTDYSAMYRVSAYVSNVDGTETDGSNATGRWLSFSLNVYYDEQNDTLAITPDSPTIIPSYRIGRQVNVPERAPFGNGEVNKDIGPAINPTINGFVQAYAESSVSSHEAILQYIDDKNDISLYDGFGGTVKLNGSPDTAIKRTIYNNDDGVYRVDLTINWIDTVASGNDDKVEYVGKYIMRVKPEGDGKYTVSSFVPYTYYRK